MKDHFEFDNGEVMIVFVISMTENNVNVICEKCCSCWQIICVYIYFVSFINNIEVNIYIWGMKPNCHYTWFDLRANS